MGEILTKNGSILIADGDVLTIEQSSGSGDTPAPEKDVNFIDYDGTIVYSYTKSEFASLSAMPANPTHTGLTAQGWNWSLADAKTYVATYGKLWIGQMYITSSGKTEIDIELNDAGLLSPYLKIAINGTVTIDWGDGSTNDTVTGTSLYTAIYTLHTYATTGNYTISIGVTSGSFTFYDYYILSHTNSTGNTSRRYNTSVIAIRLGSGITSIDSSAFYYCYSLRSITIPGHITSIGNRAFYFCYFLQSITIPSGVTSIGTKTAYSCSSLQSIAIPNTVTSIGLEAFRSCYSLQSVTIPNSVISIGTDIFQYCYSMQNAIIPTSITSIEKYMFGDCSALQSITIPNSITSIEEYAFYDCYSLYKLTFKSSTPPTVSSSSTFSYIPTDCIIYVPSGKLTDYTTATNYPDPNTYTYVEET